MKTLVIVESPNKVKTVKGYLGSNDYLVSASVGHIRDLKKSELSIDLDNNFEETYEILVDEKNPNLDKRAVVKKLQDLAKNVDLVLLATDPDREGEAISWHLEYVLKKYNKNIKRVTFKEITKNEVLKSIDSQRDIDIPLVNAQRTRRILDRIVGYQVSGLLQKKMDGNLSAGRVQSAVLRLIKDRDDEIRNFIPKEYWNIHALLNKKNLTGEDNSFKAKLVKKGDQDIVIPNKETYDTIINDLNNANYIVDNIENKVEKKKPEPPLITSSLQKHSYNLFKYDSETTMKVAQQLFEGIEIDGHRSGLITYMRTDSTTVSKDFQAVTFEHIKSLYGDKYVPDKPQTYSNKENAQEAHECIRPSYLNYEPDEIKKYLTQQQYDVYSLIYHRFLCSQMSSAIFDTVKVTVKAKDYLFTEKGSILKFDGYLIHNKLKSSSNKSDKLLPNVEVKEELDLNKLEGEQKFTEPPSLFDEGTLIETLEKLGIGRPSTYATIIKTIKARAYVIVTQEKGQKKEYFQITDLGRRVVVDLISYFSNLFNLDYTKQMEDFLDDVEHGNRNYIDVLNEFYKGFKQELDNALNNMPITKAFKYHENPCPQCSSKLIVKKGKFGEYVECEKFSNSCNFRAPISAINIEESDITCPYCNEHKLIIKTNKDKAKYFVCRNESCPALPFYTPKELHKEPCDKCGKPMVLRKTANGKFYACLGYYNKENQCKNARPFIDPKNSKTCDKCGKPMIIRKGGNGDFWACTGYPDCKNTESVNKDNKKSNGSGSKSTPVESKVKCDKCGSPMLIRTNKSDPNKKFLGCSNYPQCNNAQPYKE